MPPPISSAQALGRAFDFTAQVWRRAWAIQLLAAIGPALIFVASVSAVDPERALDLTFIGWALTLVTAAPLAGAVLRLRLGGAAEAELGPGGLQLGMTEVRLAGVILGGLAATLVACLPMIALSALIIVLFRGLGLVELAGVGPTPISLAIVATALVGAATAYLYGVARLALILPATIARSRVAIAEGWRLGAGVGHVLGIGVLLSLAPTALILASVGGLARLLGPQGWAWQDAAAAGALFAGVMTFVQVPLTLGVLGAVYSVSTQRLRRLSQFSRGLGAEFDGVGA